MTKELSHEPHHALYTALLAGTALATPALAADLPAKAPPPLVPIAPAYIEEWSGIYVGLEGGYGWGRQQIDSASIGGFGRQRQIEDILASGGRPAPVFPDFTGPGNGESISQRGGLFGGFVGVQKQLGNWVFGLEADFDGASIQGSSFSSSVQNGARVTVLGITTGGALTTTAVTGGGTVVTRSLAIDTKIDELDWKLTSNWIFGVEYLHYEFPKHTIALSDSSGSVSVVDTRESVDAVKGRVSPSYSPKIA